jgi:hypothetical protein
VSIATAVNAAASAEGDDIPKLAGVLLPSAGFKAYVRRLPTAEGRAALRADTRTRPKEERRGYLIAAASCYGDGTDVPPDSEAAYAAALARAKPADIDRLFKVACAMNGTTPVEMLA